MAEQKAKAKGKKIGRWSRKPTNVNYKARNQRDANKKRRMERQAKLMRQSRAKLGDTFDIRRKRGDAPKQITPRTFPGWEYREGYGWVRV